MDKPGVSVSSFDCDVLRSAFITAVINENIPEDKWRALAASLIGDFTGSEDVDPELLDWIVRKLPTTSGPRPGRGARGRPSGLTGKPG
jgi:hypothetical protein